MDAPELTLSQAEAKALQRDQSAIGAFAVRMADLLRQPPYFLVLKGPEPTERRALTVDLARAIADVEPVKGGMSEEKRQKVSFTRVRINPDKELSSGASTAYSRTNQPLELHTDSSYKADPHELVAFQMVRSDPDGGDTLMQAVSDIVGALDAQTVETLQRPIFPFGRGAHAILWHKDGSPRIRYYRSQVESAVENGDTLSDTARDAMKTLDEVLTREDLQYRFHVEAGETMFMDNTRVLHGRTGFGPQSDRLMYRIRIHAGCLG